MSSIFIQIPSYRDFELPKTVLSAVSSASQTNNINFGVSNVVLHEQEIYIPKNLPSFISLRQITSVAPQNIGLQKSRKIANNFYDGEDYYLQIDSHMRFEKNWDTELIALVNKYKKNGFEKPLISMYPPGYWYDEKLEEQRSSLKNTNCISFLEDPNKFSQTYVPSQTAKDVNPLCVYNSSVSGGFIFTIGNFASITPNEKIAFWGEEILIAARAYTHGYDILLADQSYVWHLYYDHNVSTQLNGRYHVWSDFKDLWISMEKTSIIELYRIFQTKAIEDVGLGSQRSLDEYGEYCGLDFVNRIVTQGIWG